MFYKQLSFKLCWICTINPRFEKEQLTSESLIVCQLGWCLLYFHLLWYTFITLYSTYGDRCSKSL